MLSDRKVQIFKAIVEEFIQTAEPVGSKTLLKKYKFNFSSATIRNEMMELESMGLLEKTHTSSGRVPSVKGYHFYVEHLMEDESTDQIEFALAQVFSDRRLNVNEVIKKSCDILSQMTNLTTIVLGVESQTQRLENVQVIPLSERSAMAVFETNKGHSESRIFHFEEQLSTSDIQVWCRVLNDRLIGTPLDELVDKLQFIRPILARKVDQYEVLFEAFMNAFLRFAADNMYFSGQANLLNQPEFADIEKLKQVMKLLENSALWRSLGHNKGDLLLQKDDQAQLVWMNDMAVVSSSIKIKDHNHAQLMVLGPNRMDYNRILSMIKTLTKAIEQIYGKESENE
ncbi:MAG: heat-inducible transcription repressor HrcA [Erysipelothrix sp.]|nr:heat-inducible transcription repressor HrcA [Erysipelothrix sp.]